MTGPGCVKRQSGPLVCFCIQSAVAGEAPALFNWKVILKSEPRRLNLLLSDFNAMFFERTFFSY